ncbi:MAG: hypothetical protein WAP03_13205 [Methylorubrum rhodinum]|uniref:hypothetical protein n=1 Tax=Methylorubrum rhodinum TaxID=29428 RepID=UPI003BB17E5C
MPKGTAKRTYAAGTDVPVQKTRLEIEALVRANGAEAFGYVEDGGTARIQFRLEQSILRFDIVMPSQTEDRFQRVHRGAAGLQRRTPTAAQAAWERGCREHWRALLLTIKAKFAAVDAKIVTFEDEFLAHVVMPDGKTVGESVRPTLAAIRAGGDPPKLLPDYTGGARG